MKYFILLLCSFTLLSAKDYSLIIDKPFDSVLFDVVEDYDRSISAVGFSKALPSSKSDAKSYTNAFDYLSSISSSHGSQMHLIKADKYANIQLNAPAQLAKYNEAVALVKTPHNGYFVGGYTLDGSLLLSKLSATGKVIFSKSFGTKNHDSMQNIILLRDGGVLTIGSSNTSRSSKDNIFETGLGLNDIYVTRFSKDGKKLWGRKYGTEYDDKGVDAVEAEDGSLIIVGTTEYANNKNISLVRLTGNGDKIWLQLYKEKGRLTPYSLIKLRDANFLLSLSTQNEMQKEQVRLMKFTLQKDILIDKEIPTAYSSLLRDIKEYSDGGIIGVGQIQDTYNTNALVMLLDSQLNMTTQEHFGGDNYDAFHAVSILHNTQAAVAGIHTSQISQESNMWLAKLNRDGSMVQVATKVESFYAQLVQIFASEIQKKQLQIKKDLSIEFIHRDLLFKAGVYTLTKKQKIFLHSFGKKLIPFLHANKEFIQTLEVNGHTSSDWGGASFSRNYLNNAKLSMQRSYGALSYLFKKQSHPTQLWLANILRGSNYAFAKKVYFENKVEDKRGSRRVAFKILLNAKKESFKQ